MITATQTVSKRGPVSAARLQALTDAGYTVRRGGGWNGAFPCWEWQLFTPAGEFVRSIPWRTVQQWGDVAGNTVRYDGVNR